MVDKVSEEEKEKIFQLLDEGKSVRDIAEELERNKNTISDYRQEWKEEKEIEEKVMQGEFTTEMFENELHKIPKVGDKKIEYAMQLVRMDEDIINDPNAIYKLLTKEIGIKTHIADTFTRGLVKRFGIGQQEESSEFYPPTYGAGNKNRQNPNPRNQYNQQPSSNMDLGQFTQRQQPQQQQPAQPATQEKQERMVTIEVPMLDDKGNPRKDSDNEIIYMKKTVPESKAEEYGITEKRDKEEDFFDKLVKLQQVGIIPKNDQKENKKEESQLMAQIRSLQNQILDLKSDNQPQQQQQAQEDENPITEKEVRKLMQEDRRELITEMERKEKDEELKELKTKFKELIEQKETSEMSNLPDDVRKAKMDMEQQETTANTVLEGLDKLGERLDSMTERIMTMGEEAEKKQSGNQQVELFKNTVNNLMQQGQSKQQAIQTARYLLYGSQPSQTNQQQQQAQQQAQQPQQQNSDELVENLKQRAKNGDL